MLKTLLRTMLLAVLAVPAAAQAQIVKTEVVGNETWTANNVYLLQGFVKVDAGESLTIEPGTVIKAKEGQGEAASALIVMRGAQIFANGLPEQPIIFTAEKDDVTDPADVLPTERGLWGGVVVLGKATTNTDTPVKSIEGVPVSVGALYGCNRDGSLADQPACDDNDNSGVLRYVSIRHTGTKLEGGNEIQGLTLGGVGRGTTVEYIESFASADDGFEIFGGTVNTKYLVSAFNDDDAFDYDQGWRGLNQFWFSIQGDDTGDNGGEFDSGDSPRETGEPFATPTIMNATFIGSGLSPTSTAKNVALTFKANAGGYVYNSVFTEFKGTALSIEDKDGDLDSRGQLAAGRLQVKNNVFARLGAATGAAVTDLMVAVPQDYAREHFALTNLFAGDAQVLRSIDRMFMDATYLDPRPADGSAALTIDLMQHADPFFEAVGYAGAFGTAEVWIKDWTALAELGYVDPTALPAEGDEIPLTAGLSQNYPNPFNPATTIDVRLDRAQHVRLVVYDVMGRQVEVLADGVQPAGNVSFQFDASNLPSGAYLYQLRTESSVFAKTMTLLK